MLSVGDDPLLDPDCWEGRFIHDGEFLDNSCPLYVKKKILRWEEAFVAEGMRFMLANEGEIDRLKNLIAQEEAHNASP